MVIRFNDITIDRKNQTIQVGSNKDTFMASRGPHYLERGRSAIFETLSHMLLKKEVTRAELFEHVYGAHPGGGPDNGPHIFDIRFCSDRWFVCMERLHLKMIKDRRASVTYFSLRRT